MEIVMGKMEQSFINEEERKELAMFSKEE